MPAQLLGLEWVPAPRPWPEPERAALLLAVAPLSEEAFFRAFLLTAFERAGALQIAAQAPTRLLLVAADVPHRCWCLAGCRVAHAHACPFRT